ncbi:MAG: hypothetical protein ACM3S1_06165 [Hyphomicrobiales bacterium]
MGNIVQVLTFRAYGVPQEQLARQSDIVALAISEFPGLIGGQKLTDPKRHLVGGVCVWRDQESLDRFRHSELYARMMMNPSLEEGVDRSFDMDTIDCGDEYLQEVALAA